jgi:osmotically-inducible protein OsmY
MKTDMQIQKDVIEELRWDPSIRETEIGVAAKDGVVTLSGVVDSYAEKYAAEHAAQRVSGVKAIAEDLTVQLVPTFKRSDTDIAHAAVTALKWDIQVPDEKVKVKVDDGYITLTGDVEWKFQQDAAERAVRYLTGAKGVINLIKVMPKRVSKFEVSAKIRDALRRNAEHDADRITVEAADGKVTLKGVVRSFAERSDAERAAWSAPGVMSVDDRIAIG